MCTHNIHFHDKKGKKNPSLFVFLSCRKKFVWIQKRVRFIQGKRAVSVRVIEILLYFGYGICLSRAMVKKCIFYIGVLTQYFLLKMVFIVFKCVREQVILFLF